MASAVNYCENAAIPFHFTTACASYLTLTKSFLRKPISLL